MESLLANPVYYALCTGDKHLNIGKGEVKYFNEQVSPFAGFDEDNRDGFQQLRDQLTLNRSILYATTKTITTPGGWILTHFIPGIQFIHKHGAFTFHHLKQIVPLSAADAEQMVALAKLTKPGPFNLRTLEFGHYHGIFVNKQLVAMAGQRLHAGYHTELSAVCTHPNHLGKGYAAALMEHQLNLILEHGQQPFLHVRADNIRAINLYKRLGFEPSREMNFYFLKRN